MGYIRTFEIDNLDEGSDDEIDRNHNGMALTGTRGHFAQKR
jgi:hypothetical protein